MIAGGIFLLLLIPLVILFTLGIPIVIGVCVYRDAAKREDCSPWLWALVAAMVPSCIGLIVYLIIRRDYPLKGSTGSESTYYQENYENKAVEPKQGIPTWGKALIIIGAVIVGICILAFIGTILYGVFGYSAIDTGMNYYHGDF